MKKACQIQRCLFVSVQYVSVCENPSQWAEFEMLLEFRLLTIHYSRPQEQDIRMSFRCISLLSNYLFIDPPMPSIDPCVSVITWVELLKQNESMETDGYVVDYVIAYSLKAPVETPSHSVKRTEKMSTIINQSITSQSLTQATDYPNRFYIYIIRFFFPMWTGRFTMERKNNTHGINLTCLFCFFNMWTQHCHFKWGATQESFEFMTKFYSDENRLKIGLTLLGSLWLQGKNDCSLLFGSQQPAVIVDCRQPSLIRPPGNARDF